MKLLLTSSGIANASIEQALVDLLGKPIAESSALFIPTGMHPYPGSSSRLVAAIRGETKSPLCNLGWASLGLLELTALTSVQRESWQSALRETDALLVWGGNVMYLNHWMKTSGVAEFLPTLENLVYVGVSAGSIVTSPYNCDAEWNREFVASEIATAEHSDRAMGYVDLTMWVHVGNPDPIFEDHTLENVEKWAANVPVPTYALDDESAIKVDGDSVEVISEGHWQVFSARP